MGTRSRIGVMHGDVIKSVNCHWDGYLEYNGKILQEHYNSAKANNLVALGDISSLGPEIGEKHPFSRFDTDMSDEAYDKLYGDMTTFYSRDRDEENVEWKVAHSFDEFLDQVEQYGEQYYYIMRDGVWYCGTVHRRTGMTGKLVPLADALINKLDEELA